MRLSMLGDPHLMTQLRQVRASSTFLDRELTLIASSQTHPELADAAANNPQRFVELLAETRQRTQEAEVARQREMAALDTDPFNIEAQRKIEEAIRQQAVMENLEHAMEFSPEAFGRVHML